MSGRGQAFLASLKDRVRYHRGLRGVVTRFLTDPRFPAVLGIDPCGACNLRCAWCGPARQREPGAAQLMDFALFADVLAECSRYGRRAMLILHNRGEPLLHPRLAEMVAVCTSRRVARVVQFATNGVLLTADRARELIDARLDGLVVSIDAATAADYAALKGADALATVRDNVRTLMRLKRERGSALPLVTAKLVRRPGREREQAAFITAWQGLVDRVQLTPYSNWGGAVPDEPLDPSPRRRYACHFLWYYPVINWDGRVSCCCATCSPAGEIGDRNREPLAEIWRGPAVQAMRARHLAGDYAGVPACTGCTYWAESGVSLDRWFRRRMPGTPAPRRAGG